MRGIGVASTDGKVRIAAVSNDVSYATNGKSLDGSSCPFRPMILLAEDEPDHRLFISLTLRNVGADVTTAENGQSAVARALQAQEQGNPFDLILMDLRMPVVNGHEATRSLREAGYRLPIIGITADAMPGDREKFIEAGGDDYITKPFATDKLAKLVQKWAMNAHARTSSG